VSSSSENLSLFGDMFVPQLEPAPEKQVFKPLPGMMPGLQRGDTLRGDEPTPAYDASKAFFDDWAEFEELTGRWPTIEDKRKPWEYRGWLMAHMLTCEGHPLVPKRWQYWMRTLDAGTVLDEPIPRIEFSHASDREAGYKAVTKLVDLVDACFGGWSSFTALVDWLTWSFGFREKPPDFTAKLHEQLYRTFNLEPFLLKPADYIGEWLAMQQSSRNPLGFYPTPHALVEMMVQMNLGEGDHRRATVCDPCVGTGRMLLHASNHSLRLYGQDINQTVLDIALINGAMYCPWLCRPFPQSIFEEKTNGIPEVRTAAAATPSRHLGRANGQGADKHGRKAGRTPVRGAGKRKKRR
jgi:hypothetical protein